MKPKILKEVRYKGYIGIIYGIYDKRKATKGVKFKIDGKWNYYNNVVFLPYIVSDPSGKTVRELTYQDIREYHYENHEASFDVIKTGTWFNRQIFLKHISQDLEEKLLYIEKKIKASIDYEIEDTQYDQLMQEVTDGLPDSLNEIVLPEGYGGVASGKY